MLHEGAGLLRGLDIGQNDAHGAIVEQARRMGRVMSGNPHERRDARVQRRVAERDGGLDRHTTVLHVDEQEVVIARPGDRRRLDDRGQLDDQAQDELAAFQLRKSEVHVGGHSRLRLDMVRKHAEYRFRGPAPGKAARSRAITRWSS
jgi:hypothetical protein